MQAVIFFKWLRGWVSCKCTKCTLFVLYNVHTDWKFLPFYILNNVHQAYGTIHYDIKCWIIQANAFLMSVVPTRLHEYICCAGTLFMSLDGIVKLRGINGRLNIFIKFKFRLSFFTTCCSRIALLQMRHLIPITNKIRRIFPTWGILFNVLQCLQVLNSF